MDNNLQKSDLPAGQTGPPPANLPTEPPKPASPAGESPTPPSIGGFKSPTPPPAGGPPKPPMPPIPPRPTPPPILPKPPVLPTPPTKPIPPPTQRPPEIALRTMKSDLEQLKAGEKPKAIPPTPPTGGPTPPKLPGLKAEPGKALPPPKKGAPKKLLIIGGAIIFGLIIIALGYFVIFPMLFPAETPPPAGIPTTPTTPTQPELPDLLLPAETPASKHQSFLKVSADLQTPISLPNLIALPQALLSEINNRPSGTGVIKEILLSDAAGQIAFSNAFPIFLSEFSTAELNELFENDFTTVIYYDANGGWPIFIAQLKSGASLNQAKTLMAQIENSGGLSNLFLVSPGTPNAASFKNGQVNSVATRYLTFSKSGAALNYGWLGNKLIISASYNGLKKVLGNL